MSRRGDRLIFAAEEAGTLPLPQTGGVVVLRAEETALYDMLGPERFLLQQGNRPLHDALAARGISVAPDVGGLEVAPEGRGPDVAPEGRGQKVAPEGSGPKVAAGMGGMRIAPRAAVGAAIVMATRQRADTLGAVAAAFDLVPEGAPIIVTGARTDGIDAVMRELAEAAPLEGRMSKAHGRVLWLRRPAELPGVVAAWARDYALRPNRDGFVTGPGMFSPEHADPGSERLAEALAGRIAGKVADLGAGWGWLAARALATCPRIEALDLHEAEARALAAARLNVTDARAAFHWSDVTRLAGGRRYDWVVTNPPFHAGRAADASLGAAFIAAASRVLKPTGRLLLVANRSLPYEASLGRAFRSVTPLKEDCAYKVIEAARPITR